jgi:hypothetical protein
MKTNAGDTGDTNDFRARICKRLRSPGIDSQKSIPLAYVAWRAGTTKKGCRTGPPGWESIPGLLKRSTNTGSVWVYIWQKSKTIFQFIGANDMIQYLDFTNLF